VSLRGRDAEEAAAALLQAHGLALVQRNYRCRFGEIDLIMRDAGALVFVEVRSRSHPDFGGAAASIDTAKQARLIRAARHYLATLDRTPPCRFDAVVFDARGQAQWIRSAFDA
jgi:putative endonuclease